MSTTLGVNKFCKQVITYPYSQQRNGLLLYTIKFKQTDCSGNLFFIQENDIVHRAISDRVTFLVQKDLRGKGQ
jgi:hypothetical protein